MNELEFSFEPDPVDAFLSGLKAIDTSLYEAAEIDGASGWQKFRYVTLPLLKPTTIYVLTISIYAGFMIDRRCAAW